MTYNTYAHVFINGSIERIQRLDGKANTKSERKRVLKSIFSELKPLAARNPQNTYYVEIRRVENL